MKDAFSLRTVRKKIVMLTKLMGIALFFAYGLTNSLPVSQEAALWIWSAMLILLVLLLDFFLSRFISKPVSQLNVAAKRMAGLDFSAPLSLSTPDEFGELAQSLNTMASNLEQTLARLEEANRRLAQDVERERLLLAQRKDLVDSLSHEMKTPLGIIRAYAEGLEDETQEEKRQKYARVIVSEVQRMNDLMVTLLDLSALESGATKLALSCFDFVELAETVAGRLLVDMPGKDFQLEYQLPEEKIYVQADQRRMEQVLTNLISNARKHVRSGGILRLELKAEQDILYVSVFNEGRRIPQEDLPRIWDKFYGDRDAPYSGSGLGLTITARILSLHSLKYGAENREDGVQFYFSTPVCQAPSSDM